MDWAVIIAGEVDLVLDAGETRRLKIGGSVVLRGGMHQWVNRSGEGKLAWIVASPQDIVSVEVEGKELGLEFIA